MVQRRKKSWNRRSPWRKPFSSIGEAPAASSGARVSTLAHIDGGLMPRRLGADAGARRQLAQALRSRAENNLPKRQQDYRYDKGTNIIEDAEQQHAGEQFLPVHLPEADQHGGIENAEAARRMAGKPQQRGRDEDDGNDDKAEIGLV